MSLTGASNQRGIAIFYAVVVGGLVLVMSFAITQIAFREVRFSALSSRSQHAFYASNSGLECALYWDLKEAQFSTQVFPNDINEKDIECAGDKVADFEQSYTPPDPNTGSNTGTSPDGTGPYGTYTSTFTVNGLGIDGDSCADVEVLKNWGGSSELKTTILVNGRDNCSASGRGIERSIEVEY